MIDMAIIRHGETDWNVAGRLQGHRDIPLNDKGTDQASRIAARLAKQSWSVLYSSDLGRAWATADTIAGKASIADVRIDARLRERNFGHVEGTTLAEREARWGRSWYESDLGVESDESLYMRGMSFLEDVVSKRDGQSIVVVTHGGWMRVMFRRLFPDLAFFHPMNTSLNLIRYESGQWRSMLCNSTEHLDPN